jgi:hypothetical protein
MALQMNNMQANRDVRDQVFRNQDIALCHPLIGCTISMN